jgi:hypothetical protein
MLTFFRAKKGLFWPAIWKSQVLEKRYHHEGHEAHEGKPKIQ